MKKLIFCLPSFIMKRFCWCFFLIAEMQKESEAGIRSIVARGFREFQITPDVIPSPPRDLLRVKFPSGVEALEGNELTPTLVKDKPTLEWNADPNTLYVVYMTDPGPIPTDKTAPREWHHWLVGNIPGRAISLGDTLTDFVGSGPMQNSGIHRYVFLVFKQPARLEFTEQRINNITAAGRDASQVAKFAEKYSLGTPVAGNFYLAQYDDYVPTIFKQFGLSVK